MDDDFGMEELERDAEELEKALADELSEPEAPAKVTVKELSAELGYSEAHIRKLINEHCSGAKSDGNGFEWEPGSPALRVVRQTLGTIKRAGGKMSPKLGGVKLPPVGDDNPAAPTMPSDIKPLDPRKPPAVTIWLSQEAFDKLVQERQVTIRTGADVVLECVVLSGARIIREEISF